MGLYDLNINLLKELPDLADLWLKKNSLIGFQNIWELKSLKILDLSLYDTIRVIDDNFNLMIALEKLYLSNTGLESLNSNAFRNLGELLWLDFSGNKLTEFNMNIFAKSNQTLHTINLNKNKITNLVDAKHEDVPEMFGIYLLENRLKCDDLRQYLTNGHWNGKLRISDNYFQNAKDPYSIDKINSNPDVPNVCTDPKPPITKKNNKKKISFMMSSQLNIRNY